MLEELNPEDKDLFEMIDELDESLEELGNESIKNFANNLINSGSENRGIIYILNFLLVVTPLVNIIYGYIILKELVSRNKGDADINKRTLEIINHSNLLTDKQIEEFVCLLDEKYIPRKIILHKNKMTTIKFILMPITFMKIFKGEEESIYLPFIDTINLFVFAMDREDDDIQIKQLHILKLLIYELRNRHGFESGEIINKSIEELGSSSEEYAADFINSNSEKIKEIMNWNDERFIE